MTASWQVHGSSRLIQWLLENDLVDQLELIVVPVILGQGTRLFPADGPDIALDVVESAARLEGRGDRCLSTGRASAVRHGVRSMATRRRVGARDAGRGIR